MNIKRYRNLRSFLKEIFFLLSIFICALLFWISIFDSSSKLSSLSSLYFSTFIKILPGNYQQAYNQGDIYSDFNNEIRPSGYKISLLERRTWFSYFITLVKLRGNNEQANTFIQKEIVRYSFNIQRKLVTFFEMYISITTDNDITNKKIFFASLVALKKMIVSEKNFPQLYRINAEKGLRKILHTYRVNLCGQIIHQEGDSSPFCNNLSRVNHRSTMLPAYPSIMEQDTSSSITSLQKSKKYPFWGTKFNERILAFEKKIEIANISNTFANENIDKNILDSFCNVVSIFEYFINNANVNSLCNFYRYLVEVELIWFYSLKYGFKTKGVDNGVYF